MKRTGLILIAVIFACGATVRADTFTTEGDRLGKVGREAPSIGGQLGAGVQDDSPGSSVRLIFGIHGNVRMDQDMELMILNMDWDATIPFESPDDGQRLDIRLEAVKFKALFPITDSRELLFSLRSSAANAEWLRDIPIGNDGTTYISVFSIGPGVSWQPTEQIEVGIRAVADFFGTTYSDALSDAKEAIEASGDIANSVDLFNRARAEVYARFDRFQFTLAHEVLASGASDKGALNKDVYSRYDARSSATGAYTVPGTGDHVGLWFQMWYARGKTEASSSLQALGIEEEERDSSGFGAGAMLKW